VGRLIQTLEQFHVGASSSCRVEKPHPQWQLSHFSVVIMQNAAEYFTALKGSFTNPKAGDWRLLRYPLMRA